MCMQRAKGNCALVFPWTRSFLASFPRSRTHLFPKGESMRGPPRAPSTSPGPQCSSPTPSPFFFFFGKPALLSEALQAHTPGYSAPDPDPASVAAPPPLLPPPAAQSPACRHRQPGRGTANAGAPPPPWDADVRRDARAGAQARRGRAEGV